MTQIGAAIFQIPIESFQQRTHLIQTLQGIGSTGRELVPLALPTVSDHDRAMVVRVLRMGMGLMT